MTAAQVAGVLLIASPFIAIFVLAWREAGPLRAIALYAMTAALVGVIGLGVYLTTGSLE